MHSIVRHIEIERHPFFYGPRHLLLGPDCQCIGQEHVVLEKFLQPRHCPRARSPVQAVTVPAIVAARLTYRTTGDIDIETQVQRVLTLAAERSEMSLAHVYRAVTCIGKHPGKSIISAVQSQPVPVGRTVGIPVVGLGVYPVGDSVAGGVLAGHQAGA